jgi:hypothetical protein
VLLPAESRRNAASRRTERARPSVCTGQCQRVAIACALADDRGEESDPRFATVHFELPLDAPWLLS